MKGHTEPGACPESLRYRCSGRMRPKTWRSFFGGRPSDMIGDDSCPGCVWKKRASIDIPSSAEMGIYTRILRNTRISIAQ